MFFKILLEMYLFVCKCACVSVCMCAYEWQRRFSEEKSYEEVYEARPAAWKGFRSESLGKDTQPVELPVGCTVYPKFPSFCGLSSMLGRPGGCNCP